MNRRELLGMMAGTGALAVAGCIGDGLPGGGSAAVADASVTTRAAPDEGCVPDGESPLTLDEGNGTVVYRTSERVSELCRAATVEEASYDSGAERLSLTFRTYRPSGVCPQAFGTVCHEVTVGFGESVPAISEVVVNGRPVGPVPSPAE